MPRRVIAIRNNQILGRAFEAMVRIVLTIIILIVGFNAMAIAGDFGMLTAIDLQGKWKLVEIKSQPVRGTGTNTLPQFTITDDLIQGFDGCNNFFGRLDQAGSITSTRRGCLNGSLKLPLNLADPMSHLKNGILDKERLILTEQGGMPESVFERVK